VTISINCVNQLIFVMVKCGVLFEVRTEYYLDELRFQFNLIKVIRGRPRSYSKCWVGNQISRSIACLSCSPQNINIKISHFRDHVNIRISPYAAFPMFNVRIRGFECSRTLIIFFPCSTYHHYLLHFQTSYLLSNLILLEGQVGTAWGPL
jgi:hypothetical protein